jgi:hypothetical protein
VVRKAISDLKEAEPGCSTDTTTTGRLGLRAYLQKDFRYRIRGFFNVCLHVMILRLTVCTLPACIRSKQLIAKTTFTVLKMCHPR